MGEIRELWSSALVETNDFTVEHLLTLTRPNQCLPKGVERIERMTVAGDELTATVLDDGE
jgi:hypothetical protein